MDPGTYTFKVATFHPSDMQLGSFHVLGIHIRSRYCSSPRYAEGTPLTISVIYFLIFLSLKLTAVQPIEFMRYLRRP